MINFQIKTDQITDFPHYWEVCVGSCHAYTALRADYQAQLIKAHQELGFKYVRFHGLFDDEMSVCIENFDFQGQSLGITYNFTNIDKIFDFLLSIGMKPFLELGFMPSCLASGGKTIFAYGGNNSMPASDAQWQELIRRFTNHLLERYGKSEVESWFFEVWNEPNLPLFFAGTQSDYFHLYEITAKTLKAIDPKLAVGGPATSFNAWIKEMVNFCEENHVPLDFISSHHYPTDDPLWQSGMDIDEFFKQTGGQITEYRRGVLQKMTRIAHQDAQGYPLYYTEWNVSAMLGDAIHDEPYAAAMIAKTLADNDGLVAGYSFWTFSDIFEEQSQKPGVFHGGFGLQTTNGIAKPAYRIFEIFHQLGTKRLEVQGDSIATVELLAVKNQTDLQLVAYNHNVPDQPIATEQIDIQLSGPDKACAIQRIDADHANAKQAWEQMNKPEYINDQQVQTLQAASQLQMETITLKEQHLQLSLMPHACAFITIPDYFAQ